MAFIFLKKITWSKYRKHKDTKVGQDLGEYPEMFNDAKQSMMIILTRTAFPLSKNGYLSKLRFV